MAMILFPKDWGTYPTAIVDTKTKNVSALQLAGVYKKMGVKNYYFHLALTQPELQGVDPHSPNLSSENKERIALECEINPWYFFREVARVPAQAGKDPGVYLFNRANVALYFSFFNNVDFALIMPRQLGKSLGTDILEVQLILFMLANSEINMLTKDNSLRVKNVERLKNIIALVPPYLRLNDKDSDNQQQITYNRRGNKYTTSVAQTSESAALNVGRGLTSPIIHVDEGPFVKFIGTIIPAMLASTIAAREEALRNNMPCGNIFTTTAGKKDDRDGKYMYDLIHGGALWNESFLDLNDKESLIAIVRKQSRGKKPIINGTFSHRQVGKDDAWLHETLEITNAKGDEADRDFFNVWTSGTLRSPLSTKLNNRIRESEIEYAHTEISSEGYIINWLIPEEEIESYMASNSLVIGLDTSELVGRDDTALVVKNIADLSVVATMAINESYIISLALYCVEFMVKYKNTTVIIERKSSGIIFIETLLINLPIHGIDPFTRVYNKIVEEASSDAKARALLSVPLSARDAFFYEGIKTKFGFSTDANLRRDLYVNILPLLAKRGGGVVRCSILSSQIRALVVKNGRIDHTASGNDDLVIAWLLCGWFIVNAKGKQYYDIDSRDCMRLAGTDGKPMTEERVMEQANQKRLRQAIEAIKEELSNTTDAFHQVKKEAEIKHLASLTEHDGGTVVTFDDLMEQAKEARDKNTKNTTPTYNVKHTPSPVNGNIFYC